MKKFFLQIIFILFLSVNAYAENIKKIHFICEFERYYEINGIDEKLKNINKLPTAITDDEFITIGIKPNEEIIILETSYWGMSQFKEPEERIIIPYSVTDNEIKFDNPGSPSSVKHTYTMNRRTGKLVMNFKNKVGEARTHSNCSVKEKLF